MARKAFSLLAAAAVLSYQAAVADHGKDSAFADKLDKAIPSMKPDRVSHTPIPGLYELTYGPDILYMTKDGRYLLDGNMFDLQERKNLTLPKRKQARADAVNGLGEKNMIVFTPKEPKYQVTVFTDVECGFCQQLHREINEYNDLGVKVRYVAFPRAGIGSNTYNTMVSVWCADDRQKAITDAKTGRPVTPKQCENPVREQYEMGRQIGVRGTPTIVLEEGDIIPGYVPPQRLVQLIETEKAGVAAR
jgi:thiol:disulfide interchange protein DsbC